MQLVGGGWGGASALIWYVHQGSCEECGECGRCEGEGEGEKEREGERGRRECREESRHHLAIQSVHRSMYRYPR